MEMRELAFSPAALIYHNYILAVTPGENSQQLRRGQNEWSKAPDTFTKTQPSSLHNIWLLGNLSRNTLLIFFSVHIPRTAQAPLIWLARHFSCFQEVHWSFCQCFICMHCLPWFFTTDGKNLLFFVRQIKIECHLICIASDIYKDLSVRSCAESVCAQCACVKCSAVYISVFEPCVM